MRVKEEVEDRLIEEGLEGVEVDHHEGILTLCFLDGLLYDNKRKRDLRALNNFAVCHCLICKLRR